MYARFIRWASDRIEENGVVAFVSNSSFIDSRTYDGFRKIVAEEFNDIWIIDLKGNARTSGERRRRESGNIFEDKIRVGVAVYFLVKRRNAHGCQIRIQAVRDYAKADEKRTFLSANTLGDRSFQPITPDKVHSWINLANNDFETLLPLADRATKYAKVTSQERAIFRLYSQGLKTNRDEWVCSFSKEDVARNTKHLLDSYNAQRKKLAGTVNKKNVADLVDYQIKWTRKLKRQLVDAVSLEYDSSRISASLYRPYVKNYVYYSWELNEDLYQLDRFLPAADSREKYISFVNGNRLDFATLAGDTLPNYAIYSLDPAQFIPLHSIEGGKKCDNITDWALEQFRDQYEKGKTSKRLIDKDAIFHYVYGVLHDPAYREKYALNLNANFRAFPSMPISGHGQSGARR